MQETPFFTNHAYVLFQITQDPDVRLRDMADAIGITERAAGVIVRQLVEAGYVSTARVGRNNHYVLHEELPMRAASARGTTVGALMTLLATREAPRHRAAATAARGGPTPEIETRTSPPKW